MQEFTWNIQVLNDTIQYQCCLDSNGTIVNVDRDLITFRLTHEQYIEYQRYLLRINAL